MQLYNTFLKNSIRKKLLFVLTISDSAIGYNNCDMKTIKIAMERRDYDGEKNNNRYGVELR